MRRIKLISERVFAEKATVRYVPTRYETPREDSWLFDSYERKQVFTDMSRSPGLFCIARLSNGAGDEKAHYLRELKRAVAQITVA